MKVVLSKDNKYLISASEDMSVKIFCLECDVEEDEFNVDYESSSR